MVVGRGSFIDSFPLFGCASRITTRSSPRSSTCSCKIRDNEHVHWSGKHRPPLTGQGVYPRPAPESAADLARSGRNAEIVRSRRRARPSADGRDHRRRDAALPAAGRSLPRGRRARRTLARSAQGRRALARLRRRDDQGGRRRLLSRATRAPSPTSAKERGWPPVTRADFDAQRGPEGALLVGSPRRWPRRSLGTARRSAASRASRSR